MVGQANEGDGDAAPATWCAYAGLGARHLLVIADGSAGAEPSRFAAEVCARAVVSSFGGTTQGTLKSRLEQALDEAFAAGHRANADTHLEGRVRVALVAVLLTPRHVVVGRHGGAEAWIMSGGQAIRWGQNEAQGMPEGRMVVQHPRPHGGMLFLLSADAARVVTESDIITASQRAPQHAAQSLAAIARRRGACRAVAVQTVAPDGEQITLDTELLPTARGAGFEFIRRHFQRFTTAAVAGALCALLMHAPTPAPPADHVPIRNHNGAVSPRMCFEHPDTEAAAAALLHAMVTMGAREQQRTHDVTLRWLRAHPSKRHADVLLHILDDAPPPAVRTWAKAALKAMLP